MKFRNIIFGSLSNLTNITRFSINNRIKPENVSEHCFWVAVFSTAMGLSAELEGYKVDWKKLMSRSCFHDMEEATSGDFPRPFKYSTPELHAAIETAAAIAAERTAKELCENPTIAEWLIAQWGNAKDKTKEGAIIELADFVSVLRWGIREKEIGNRTVVAELAILEHYIKKFDDERFEFICGFVEESKILLKEFLYA